MKIAVTGGTGNIGNEVLKAILPLAFVGGKNAILFGPGGHAKSQMLEKVVEALDAKDETFVQFFG
mgnify:CR=1 FL=1